MVSMKWTTKAPMTRFIAMRRYSGLRAFSRRLFVAIFQVLFGYVGIQLRVCEYLMRVQFS